MDLVRELDRLAPVDTGAAHMAGDRARLEAVAAGEEGPSFRLYRWSPGCVSLGLGQAEAAVPREVLAAAGLDLVRRPTGGRGLLHAEGDLTYAIVFPGEHPVAQLSVLESYRVISRCVVRALEAIGLEAELVCHGGPASGPREEGACFEEHLVETVLVGGRKVCGSAQARRRRNLLQHGSIPMRVDYALQARLFLPGLPLEEGMERLRRSMSGLLDALEEQHPGKSGDASIPVLLARTLHQELSELVGTEDDRP